MPSACQARNHLKTVLAAMEPVRGWDALNCQTALALVREHDFEGLTVAILLLVRHSSVLAEEGHIFWTGLGNLIDGLPITSSIVTPSTLAIA